MREWLADINWDRVIMLMIFWEVLRIRLGGG